MYDSKIIYNSESMTLATETHRAIGTQIIENVLFTSSGSAKYYLRKNGEPVAALFNTKYILNASYPFQIYLQDGDVLAFDFENRENVPIDMHVNYSVRRV